MTDKASYALLHGFGNVAIALAIGYVFYKLIRTKDTPTKVSDYGRNWLAWMVLIATMAGLPNVIMKPSPDAIFKFIAPLVVFSLIAFVFGLIYGKFKLPKKALNNSSAEVEKQPNTSLDNQTSGYGINCSSCGAEITPKGAKFCKHCGTKTESSEVDNKNTQTKIISQTDSSSSTFKAEVVKPPTIEKKIVDVIQPKEGLSKNQEKKSENTAAYINEKRDKRSGVKKNTKETVILIFIFTALFFLVFFGDKNTKVTSTTDENTSYGTFAYDNGDVYTGQLKNGQPTWEKGQYKIKKIVKRPITSKSKYTGKSVYSKGVITLTTITPTNEVYNKYDGELKNGVPHGVGIDYWWGEFDHVRYKGEWVNGKKHGKGVYTTPSGDSYDGEWKNDNRHGKGVSVSSTGGSYDGEWKDGKYHGKGVSVDRTGGSYDGEWKDGVFHGLGTITLNNGYQIKGVFKNGKKVD